jgi:hypothetical protein
MPLYVEEADIFVLYTARSFSFNNPSSKSGTTEKLKIKKTTACNQLFDKLQVRLVREMLALAEKRELFVPEKS